MFICVNFIDIFSLISHAHWISNISLERYKGKPKESLHHRKVLMVPKRKSTGWRHPRRWPSHPTGATCQCSISYGSEAWWVRSHAFPSEKNSLGKAELQTSLEPFVAENSGEYSPALNSCWELTLVYKSNRYGSVRMFNKAQCSTASTSGTKKKKKKLNLLGLQVSI